jgi:hypothetical protein
MFCKHKKIYPAKQGVDYKTVPLRDFDLVLFSGGSTGASGLIEWLEKRRVGAGTFSHVGMIITSKSLPFQGLEDGKLYIFESTQSGKLTDGVLNIEGESYLGSQIREFDQVMKGYDSNPNSAIAVRRLINNPLDTMELSNVKAIMSFLYGKYNHRRYEVDIFQLFEAMIPKLRVFRSKKIENTFIFCSQLVATVYKGFGLVSKNCNPGDVVPMDFVVEDEDHMINRNIFHPVEYIRYMNFETMNY